MHFLAELELQSVWDLVVNFSEEIVECRVKKVKKFRHQKANTATVKKKQNKTQHR